VRFSRDSSWLRRALPPEVGDGDVGTPDFLPPEIRAIVDLFGWARIPEAVEFQVSGGNTAFVVVIPATPQGTIRVVLFAQAWHDDVVNHTMSIALASSTSPAASISPPVSSPALIEAVLLRTIIMNPGDTLYARAQPGVAGAPLITGLARAINLPIGEYLLLPS